jgi:hypothetical protein
MEKLACGCPGSAVQTIEKESTTDSAQTGRIESELRQWPTQLRLVPPSAPWLKNADLLIAADCTPFAYAEFHRDFIKDRVLVNACPKLDETSDYVEKLAEIISENDLKSLTVAIMEVPCCRGLAMMAEQAIAKSGKDIQMELAVIGVNGEKRD